MLSATQAGSGTPAPHLVAPENDLPEQPLLGQLHVGVPGGDEAEVRPQAVGGERAGGVVAQEEGEEVARPALHVHDVQQVGQQRVVGAGRGIVSQLRSMAASPHQHRMARHKWAAKSKKAAAA